MIFVAAFLTFFAVAAIGQTLNDLFQGNFVTIPVVAVTALLAWLAIRQAIRKPINVPKYVQYIGWGLICFGITGFFVDFTDLVMITTALGICAAGLVLILYSRYSSAIFSNGRLPEKEPPRAITEEPGRAEEPPVKQDLKSLFDQAIRCSSSRANPDFRTLLTKTRDLYFDLQEKEISINAVLTEQIEKLLTMYLDLDNDPVQTQKTNELKSKVRQAFETIYEALENLYDKQRSSDQLDLETDLVSLEMLLRQQGLLDSDFELNTNEKRSA